ncbi:MAG: ATP-binding cassette domain-containing protein, partial [Phycisphaerales bacterium]|nr:ATP-binding cassette domain-containing protein [Phycisphaerales bacterium]
MAQADSVIQSDAFKLWYGNAQAIHGITMGVPRGAVTALIGPSGCGKSTFLRSINRMNDLVEGVRVEGGITLNGSAVYEPTVDVIELRKR